MGVLFWDELTRQQATALTREWEAGREARLAWLSTRLGRPLTFTADDLDVAWTWFLTWRHDPVGAASEPTPVWWREWRGQLNARGEDMAASQHFERDESVGLDALGHLCEEILRRDCPLLERWIHPAGPPKSPWMLANAPCLAVRRPRPSHGLTHTAITNVMGAVRTWGDEWRDPWREARPRSPRIYYEECVREYHQALTASPPPTLAEQVASEPPFDWIRDPDDPDYPYQFGFDDVISHEHEDLVTAFIAALREHPDIKRVEHLDREVVGIAGRIKVRQLRQWAWDWWKTHLPKD